MIKRPGDEGGYSLVEVMAAIVILTVAIIPMVTMFDSGLKSASTSGNYDKARALANTNLEQIKSKDYAAASALPTTPCPEPGSPGFSCALNKNYVKVDAANGTFGSTSDSDPKAMLRVTVTVGWNDGNSYSATGLVSD